MAQALARLRGGQVLAEGGVDETVRRRVGERIGRDVDPHHPRGAGAPAPGEETAVGLELLSRRDARGGGIRRGCRVVTVEAGEIEAVPEQGAVGAEAAGEVHHRQGPFAQHLFEERAVQLHEVRDHLGHAVPGRLQGPVVGSRVAQVVDRREIVLVLGIEHVATPAIACPERAPSRGRAPAETAFRSLNTVPAALYSANCGGLSGTGTSTPRGRNFLTTFRLQHA